MQIKKISTKKNSEEKNFRPSSLTDFIGQEDIKKVLEASVTSAHKRGGQIGHVLFSGESGYGKTSLAQIIAKIMQVNFKVVTGYAIGKPSELITILNTLETGDILFIDEIHRLRPNIEEVLYIAMEDFVIDMVIADSGNVRIPLNKFTLIGATTKIEALSVPLKNRFIYKFHFVDYTTDEKILILKKYLQQYCINYKEEILQDIAANIVSVPREIHNFCVKIRDYLISLKHKNENIILEKNIWEKFKKWGNLMNGGLTMLHKRYLDILEEFYPDPVGLKTIALKLGLNELAVQDDIESLLLKLGLIDKTAKGRIMRK